MSWDLCCSCVDALKGMRHGTQLQITAGMFCYPIHVIHKRTIHHARHSTDISFEKISALCSISHGSRTFSSVILLFIFQNLADSTWRFINNAKRSKSCRGHFLDLVVASRNRLGVRGKISSRKKPTISFAGKSKYHIRYRKIRNCHYSFVFPQCFGHDDLTFDKHLFYFF